jgi:hypothetical protein
VLGDGGEGRDLGDGVAAEGLDDGGAQGPVALLLGDHGVHARGGGGQAGAAELVRRGR